MALQKGNETREQAKINRLVLDMFQESTKQIRNSTKKSTSVKLYDLTGDVLRRRKEAVSAYMETVTARYEERYPDLAIDEAWARLCAMTGRTISGLDHMYAISLASSLWILDALQHSGRMAEAMPYLPDQAAVGENPPGFLDSCHENTVVQKMTCLVRERDGISEPSQSYINSITAARREPVEWNLSENSTCMSSRERFNSILSLIEPAAIEQAIAHFQDKFWEFLDCYFACIDFFAQKESIHLKKSTRIFDQCERLGESMGFSLTDEKPDKDFPFALTDPVSAKNAKWIEEPWTHLIGKTWRGEWGQLEDMLRNGMDEENLSDRWEENRLNFPTYAPMLPMLDGKKRSDWIKRFGEEATETMQKFTIDNPYEICFGFLCLVERGDHLPWLYTPAVAVLTAAAAKLPWTVQASKSDREESKDEAAEQPKETEGGNAETDTETDVSPEKSIQQTGLYTLKYTPPGTSAAGQPVQPVRYCNLPQMVYQLTGVVMPRSLPQREKMRALLAQCGLPEAEAEGWEYYLQLCQNVQHLMKLPAYEKRGEILQPASEQGLQKQKENRQEILENKIRAMDTQIAELRKALYESSKKAERTQAEITRIQEETANERQELLDLRELVFHLESRTEPELEPEKTIQFPFIVKQRTVVFGGHDTWLKAIRSLLPNVSFAGREANPNADMIRHSDVVWIQANALAHKRYYKIIDIVRVNHIPIRYFNYASAEKCALQLAIEDSRQP